MSEWYFVEQQSLYRRQTFLDEAAKSQRAAQSPRGSLRAQVADALIVIATRLAPATTAGRLGIARS